MSGGIARWVRDRMPGQIERATTLLQEHLVNSVRLGRYLLISDTSSLAWAIEPETVESVFIKLHDI